MPIFRIKHVVSAAMVIAALSGNAVAEEAWYPLKVSATKADGTKGLFDYVPLSASGKASKNWSICVSFPHLKDPTFVALNYGMIEEAKLLGVSVRTFDAGGYTALAKQISQIEDCAAAGANAVVMVAIAQDGMNNILMQLKEKHIPVIDAINGVSSRDTAARVLTNPREEGLNAGQYLAKRHPAGSKEVRIAWLPGPAGAGFVTAFNAGFQEGIAGSAVNVVETKYGDVGKEVQSRLVEDILQTHQDLDYIVGTAVMTEAAIPILKARNVADKVKLVSVYMTPGVYPAVQAGDIDASGAAPWILTARIMLDQAVRSLEGKVEYTDVFTGSKVYTKDTIRTLNLNAVLPPATFSPVFNLGK